MKSVPKQVKRQPERDLTFEERVFDFGIAGPGQSVTHVFTFSNVGSLPVSISGVTASCGSTAALLSRPNIPPGSTGKIKATIETQRYEGRQRATFIIHSNDPDEPQIELTIQGMIKRNVAVVPQGLNFGDVRKGGLATRRVRVLQLSEEPLAIKRIEADQMYLMVAASRFRDENSRGFNIDITLKRQVPVGLFTDVITLHTNVKKRPRIDVPVWANILGRIQVQPKILSLGTISKGGKISQPITVSSSDGKRFHVLKITCDLPFIHLQSSVDKKNNVVTISGTIDKVSPAGRLSGRIDISTDDPDQSVIHVPVYGVIKGRL